VANFAFFLQEFAFFRWWKILSLPFSEKNVLLNEVILGKLSPLQKKILIELGTGPQTLDVLSSKTGSSVYTIGKQLSLLQMRASYNPLHGKGISKPLVKKQKGVGIKTTYFLAQGL